MNKLALITIVMTTLGLSMTACASKPHPIVGTKIPDNEINRGIIQAVEEYRVAMEKRDAAGLLLMASKKYWEDGGTPTGGDDYGYEGLREVLKTRLSKVSDVRYSMRYMAVARRCKSGTDTDTNEDCRAYVDVLLDASYTVKDARGVDKRPDKRDQNQLVMEWENGKWLFISGM